MIGVANRAGAYDDEHEHLLLTYAAQVAIAIRNAQLYAEIKSAKDELERNVAARTRELAEAKEARWPRRPTICACCSRRRSRRRSGSGRASPTTCTTASTN